MNILFVGHDISYVNFYCAIESALRSRVDLLATHIYFRPSAWFYSRLCFKVASLSPSLYRLIGKWPDLKLDNAQFIDLDFYSKYNDEAKKLDFARLYASYAKFISKALSATAIDVAILPGEFRLFEQATINYLKSMPQPPEILYFEAGPPGYIYFDLQGVNANASFAQNGINELLENINVKWVDNLEKKKKTPTFTRKLLLGIDVVWLWLAKKTRGLLDLDEFWIAMRNRLRSRHSASATEVVGLDQIEGQRYIIFVGQVRNDINHTHFGVPDDCIEKNLLDILRSDPSLNLIWRDHPLELSEDLFRSISSAAPGRVIRLNSISLKQVMECSEGVVTVNSNAGLEALALGLPVRIFGASYYASLKGVCTDNQSFDVYRKKILEIGRDVTISDDADRFFKKCFLPIDYRGENFDNAFLAAEVIISCKK